MPSSILSHVGGFHPVGTSGTVQNVRLLNCSIFCVTGAAYVSRYVSASLIPRIMGIKSSASSGMMIKAVLVRTLQRTQLTGRCNMHISLFSWNLFYGAKWNEVYKHLLTYQKVVIQITCWQAHGSPKFLRHEKLRLSIVVTNLMPSTQCGSAKN